MPSDLLWALVNPFAQVPADWPVGLWGAFLIFLMPIGAGAPLAVVMARDAIPPVIAPLVPGWLIPVLTPLIIAGMYLVSDLIIAVTYEPMFALLGWLARIVPVFGRIRDVLAISTGRVGLRAAGVRGPASLILVSLLTSVPFARGVTAAAGHGFLTGWGLAIVGDMLGFCILMTTTLWLSGILGDDRWTVGIIFVALVVVGSVAQQRLMPADQRARLRGIRPVAPGALQPAPVVVTANTAGSASRRAVNGSIAGGSSSHPAAPPRSKKARRKQRH